jgi:hypothetical protein
MRRNRRLLYALTTLNVRLLENAGRIKRNNLMNFGKIAGLCKTLLLSVLFISFSRIAFAGHWEATYTYSGSNTWAADDLSGGADWNPDTGRYMLVSATAINAVNLSTSGTVTIKMTWYPDDETDKPDAAIYVHVNSWAHWDGGINDPQPMGQGNATFTGSVNNGIDSPTEPVYTTHNGSVVLTGGDSIGIKSIIKRSPQDYDRESLNEISVTLPAISLSANMTGSATVGSMSASAYCSVIASVVPFHAHPTNMRANPSVDIGPYYLKFSMEWDSTGGGTYPPAPLADLTSSKIQEYVTYSGDGDYVDNGAGFRPKIPPWFDVKFHNPATYATKNADVPPLIDQHSWFAGFTGPLRASSFTGTQYYRFHCTTCMVDGQWETLMGPISIVRSVSYGALSNHWYFKITKLTSTSTTVIDP